MVDLDSFNVRSLEDKRPDQEIEKGTSGFTERLATISDSESRSLTARPFEAFPVSL